MAHKNDLNFNDFTFKEGSDSIKAQIINLERSIINNANKSLNPQNTLQTRTQQVERLVQRLNSLISNL